MPCQTLACEQNFGIFVLLAHCFGPRKWAGWVPFFFIQRCHRLILKTSFHLHNRMGSDSLLSYYLLLGTLHWKVTTLTQKGSVRNTEQWEFDIFLLLPPEKNQSNYFIAFMYFIKECGVIFIGQQASWKWQNCAACLRGHSWMPHSHQVGGKWQQTIVCSARHSNCALV